MKFNIILFFLFSIIILQNEVFAQPQLWEMYSTSNQPFVNVVVEKYESDSLYLKSMNQLFIFHQDSIEYLIKKRDSNFGLGFIFGAVAGGIFGAKISSGSDGFLSGIGKGLSIVLGSVIGGVVGGGIGLSSGADQKYLLLKLKSEDKRILLNRLFN
jgi:hypothetical protein